MISSEANDNHGRRNSLRNALSNDPMYRRVKDAMLIIVAAVAAFSALDIPIGQIFKKDDDKQESRGRLWERVSSNERNIAVMQTSLHNIEETQREMKQDMREILREIRRR